MDEDEDQKAAGVGEDVPLSPLDLLSRVISTNTAAFRGFDRLFFTPWLLGTPLLIGAAATTIAVAIMFVPFRNGLISRCLLAGMGVLYLVFVGVLLGWHVSG